MKYAIMLRATIGIIVLLSFITMIGCAGCTMQGSEEPIDTKIVSGSQYGCDIILYLDGFGYAYDLGTTDVTIERCRVEFERGNDDGDYRVFLCYDGQRYCVGLLNSYDDGMTDPVYGCSYLYDTSVDDVERFPVKFLNEQLPQFDFSKGGIIRSFDAANYTLDYCPTLIFIDQGYFDWLVPIDDDSIITVYVPQDATLIVRAMDDSCDVLVTRERLFALLEYGYIGLLPYSGFDEAYACFIDNEDGQLVYLKEIGNP